MIYFRPLFVTTLTTCVLEENKPNLLVRRFGKVWTEAKVSLASDQSTEKREQGLCKSFRLNFNVQIFYDYFCDACPTDLQ